MILFAVAMSGFDNNVCKRKEPVQVNSKNLFIRAALFASPLWLLLALHAYGAGGGTAGSLFAVLHAPGMLLMLLFSGTWEQLHNYELWHYLIGDFVFYYLVILLVLYLKKRFSRKLTREERT